MSYKPALVTVESAGWPNGKALDFGSRDCRFEPCVGHSFYLFFFFSPAD